MKFVHLITTFLLAAAISVAQTTTGSLTGMLVDQSGAAVPNVEITVTEQARQAAQTARADETGRFVFTALQPGSYTLEVKAQGFKGLKRENIAFRRTIASRWVRSRSKWAESIRS